MVKASPATAPEVHGGFGGEFCLCLCSDSRAALWEGEDSHSYGEVHG